MQTAQGIQLSLQPVAPQIIYPKYSSMTQLDKDCRSRHQGLLHPRHFMISENLTNLDDEKRRPEPVPYFPARHILQAAEEGAPEVTLRVRLQGADAPRNIWLPSLLQGHDSI